MKQLSLPLLAFLWLSVSGCKQIDDLLTFDILQSQTIIVPAQLVIPGQVIKTLPMVIALDQELKDHNTKADLVKDVLLSKMELTIENPADEDFGFLKDIEISLAADNLNEVTVASLPEVPAAAGRTIQLNSTNQKLDEFLKAPSFTVRAKGSADEPVQNIITVKINMILTVTADPL